jgi:hypothetical protein
VNRPSSAHRVFVGVSSKINPFEMSGASSKTTPSNHCISLATFTQHSHFDERHRQTQNSPDAPLVGCFRPQLTFVQVYSKMNLLRPAILDASSKIAPSNQRQPSATSTQHSHFDECHLHTQKPPDASRKANNWAGRNVETQTFSGTTGQAT